MTPNDRNFAVVEASGDRNFSTRLMLGRYFADIVADPDRPLCHWVIQRVGSAEVLRLGQETSFSLAVERAHHCLKGLVMRHKRQPHSAALYQFGESVL
jgi:hypothetical protein